MLQMAHTGLYVKDIDRVTEFYIKVFHMHVICEKKIQKDELIRDLLKHDSAGVLITKLITDQGKKTGVDDMLELLQVVGIEEKSLGGNIYQSGCMHIGFRVDKLDEILKDIIKYGGRRYTEVYTMSNGNRCCFAQDVEHNWLELIERR